MNGGTTKLNRIRYSPDGAYLVTAGRNKKSCVFDAATGEQRFCVELHGREVEAIAISPDTALVATGCRNRAVRVWDASTGAERLRVDLTGSWVTSLDFSPDGSSLIANGDGSAAVTILYSFIWIWGSGGLRRRSGTGK